MMCEGCVCRSNVVAVCDRMSIRVAGAKVDAIVRGDFEVQDNAWQVAMWKRLEDENI